MGTYYVEAGTNQRPSKVVYDRGTLQLHLPSTATSIGARSSNGQTGFTLTGITPAIALRPPDLALEAVRKAQDMGITVSCDL